MNSQEILKKWKQGVTINGLSKQLFEINKKQYENDKQNEVDNHKLKQAQFKRQREYIKQQRQKNKKYKFDGERIVVGKLKLPKKPTEYDARKIVEQIIYQVIGWGKIKKSEPKQAIKGLCYKCKSLYVDAFPNKPIKETYTNGICVVCGNKGSLIATI